MGIKKELYYDLCVLKASLFSSFHFQLQQLNDSHCAELGAARQTNTELQDRLQSMTSEMLELKSSLMAVSTERDGLKEHLRCQVHFKPDEI